MDYAAHGVREYWIIDPVAEAVEQHVLVEAYTPTVSGTYRQLGRWSGDEEITNVIVPGFHLPDRALFERRANLDALAALGR